MKELGAKAEETQAAVDLQEGSSKADAHKEGKIKAGVITTGTEDAPWFGIQPSKEQEGSSKSGAHGEGKIKSGVIPTGTEDAPWLGIQPSKEQEGSSKDDAHGEGKIKAGADGDQIPMETKEAPWFDIYHEGKSVTEIREEEFAAYRRAWEHEWGNGNSFEDLSLLSSMIFTHLTPGESSICAVVGRTFQLLSVKIAELKGIQWPLKVYGVVAARDDVDKNRIPLFLRSREDYQIVREKDPFLQLIGPCRSIVSEEPVEIEIQLRLHRGKKSEDRPLISDVYYYNGENSKLLGCSDEIENHFCRIELSYQQLDQSVQATFFDFRVEEASSFECGVKILCSSLPHDNNEDVIDGQILFDSGCGKLTMGCLSLARKVVSVDLEGNLQVTIQAYAPSGGIDAQGIIIITPQKCHTSHHTCDIGGRKMNFTVAWSLLLADKTLMLMNGYMDPFQDLPSFDPSVLEKLGITE